MSRLYHSIRRFAERTQLRYSEKLHRRTAVFAVGLLAIAMKKWLCSRDHFAIDESKVERTTLPIGQRDWSAKLRLVERRCLANKRG